MKIKNTKNEFSKWISDPDHFEDIDNEYGDYFDTKIQPQTDEDVHHLNEPGQSGIKRNAKMREMENILITAGWSNDSSNDKPNIGNPQHINPKFKTGSKWKAEVQKTKQQVIDNKHQRIPTNTANKQLNHFPKYPLAGDVKIVDKEYLNKTFQDTNKQVQKKVDNVVTHYRLNEDQERAFRIVANHVTSENSEQLKMYLAGMGGTGKSQVIKALIKLFNDRKESHKFLVTAPTGSASALLGGSTYHSVLGIKGIDEHDYDNANNHARVRTNLAGVEYLFLDEVSMLSCLDMYKISSQLAKSIGNKEDMFGGINICRRFWTAFSSSRGVSLQW